MQRELKMYLWDMRGAGEDICKFTKDKCFEQYLADDMLRAAVERKFEIIGEALVQARHLYPEIRANFSGANQIVAFRNRIATATSRSMMPWSGQSRRCIFRLCWSKWKQLSLLSTFEWEVTTRHVTADECLR